MELLQTVQNFNTRIGTHIMIKIQFFFGDFFREEYVGRCPDTNEVYIDLHIND